MSDTRRTDTRTVAGNAKNVQPEGRGSSRPGGGGGMRPGGRFGGKIETPKNIKRAIGRLIRYFGNEWTSILGVAVAVIAGASLRAMAPAKIGVAIRRHIEVTPDVNAFVRALVVVLFIYVGTWITGALAGAFTTRIGNRLVYRMRKDTFAHIQKLTMSYFDRHGIGDVISRITNDIEMIYNALTNGFVNLLSSVVSIGGILIAMFVLNPLLTLVVLAILPLMLATTVLIGRFVRKAYRVNQKLVGRITGRIEESVSAVKVIKSFHREKAVCESFRELSEEAKRAGERAEIASFALRPVMRFMNGLSLALVVGVGGSLIAMRTGGYSIGLLTAFVLYARRFFEPLRHITNVYNLIQSALAGAERVFDVLDAEPEIVNAEDAESISDIRGEVSFRNVSFAYLPGSNVLEAVSFDVESGQTVAIVGPTGAGKTTLVNLLSRFYDVGAGEVLIDGKNIKNIEIDSLRTRMGVVLQEPYFFATSIMENIRYGNERASVDDAVRAAEISKADDFIRRLPEGYDTMLLERGMNLSQGERQLLAIARAILADPRILILDEATSNVDTLTETLIQRGLLELMRGRTSFIIAHRLSTIRNADQVFVVHDRRIVERGTHAELMKRDGFYARLYRLQYEKPEITEDMAI